MKTARVVLLLALMTLSSAVSVSQWSEQNTGVVKKLNCCRIFTYNIAWVCGDSGTVLRSTNNGQTWLNLTGNGIPLNTNLISIGGLSDNAVIIGGNNGSGSVIYMSSNSGANWFQTFSQPGGTLRSLSSRIYIGDPVGGRWSIWSSPNYGLTWDSAGYYLQQNGSEHGWNNSFYNDGDDYAFTFGTNNYRIYKRYNTTWTTISINTEQNIYSLNWCSQQNGYAGGTELLLTTNNGINWISAGIPGSGNIVSITSQPGMYRNWVARADNKIYEKEYGSSWVSSYTSPAGNFVFLKVGVSYTSLYALKDNGVISYKPVPNPPLGISNISSIADRFSLFQNYPNPFNPNTKIRFRIAESGLVKLTVYDMLGREVQTLVNQELKPGTYEVEFNGADSPSGVYYYKLESGIFVETRRMVLIK